MNPAEESFIIAYIQGKLPPDQASEANRRYAADPEWAAEVEQARLLMEAAHQSRQAHMRTRIQAAQQSAGTRPPRNRGRNLILVFAAASIVLLAVVGILWQGSPSSPHDIFLEEFQPLPDLSHSTLGSPSEAAYTEYSRDSFARALPLLQAIDRNTPAGDTAQVFIANCHLKLDEYDSAIVTLDAYLQTQGGHPPLQWDARWYLALGYLAADKPEAAEPLLREIVGNGGAHLDQARRVLERVE